MHDRYMLCSCQSIIGHKGRLFDDLSPPAMLHFCLEWMGRFFVSQQIDRIGIRLSLAAKTAELPQHTQTAQTDNKNPWRNFSHPSGPRRLKSEADLPPTKSVTM